MKNKKNINIKQNRINLPISSSGQRSLDVEISELENKITTVYFSIRKAAKAINYDIKTIIRREKKQTKKIEKGENTPYKKQIYNIYILKEKIIIFNI